MPETTPAAREGARPDCPPWCLTDHDDTRTDLHSTDLVEFPAFSAGSMNRTPGSEDARLTVHAETFAVGDGVRVQFTSMTHPDHWLAPQPSVSGHVAGQLATLLRTLSGYMETTDGSEAPSVYAAPGALLDLLATTTEEQHTAGMDAATGAMRGVMMGSGAFTLTQVDEHAPKLAASIVDMYRAAAYGIAAGKDAGT